MSTNTYISTNSRPCAACGQQTNCLKSCPDRNFDESGRLMFGQIDLPDGKKHIYLASGHQEAAVAFVQVPSQTLTFTGVMDAFDKHSEMDAEAFSHVPRVPVGAMAMIMLGLVFIAIGLILREPVSWAIYDWIHS